jgi:hypothetical protein
MHHKPNIIKKNDKKITESDISLLSQELFFKDYDKFANKMQAKARFEEYDIIALFAIYCKQGSHYRKKATWMLNMTNNNDNPYIEEEEA